MKTFDKNPRFRRTLQKRDDAPAAGPGPNDMSSSDLAPTSGPSGAVMTGGGRLVPQQGSPDYLDAVTKKRKKKKRNDAGAAAADPAVIALGVALLILALAAMWAINRCTPEMEGQLKAPYHGGQVLQCHDEHWIPYVPKMNAP